MLLLPGGIELTGGRRVKANGMRQRLDRGQTSVLLCLARRAERHEYVSAGGYSAAPPRSVSLGQKKKPQEYPSQKQRKSLSYVMGALACIGYGDGPT